MELRCILLRIYFIILYLGVFDTLKPCIDCHCTRHIDGYITVDCERKLSKGKLNLVEIPALTAVIKLGNNHLTKLAVENKETNITFLYVKDLRLSNNNLKHLNTDTFGKYFPNIQKVDLWKNYIVDLTEESLKGFKCLQIVDLSYNKIQVIEDKAFRHTPNLTKLFLNGNKIPQLPIGIFNGLFHLKNIDLSHNLIKILNISSFGEAKSLRSLNLENNSLSQWVPDGASWPLNLTSLDLSNNLLVEIPPLPKSLFSSSVNHETIFNLDNNPIYCECKEKSFESLDISLHNVCKFSVECKHLTLQTSQVVNGLDQRGGSSCLNPPSLIHISHILQQPTCKRPKVECKMEVYLLKVEMSCFVTGFPQPSTEMYETDLILQKDANGLNFSVTLSLKQIQQYACTNKSLLLVAKSVIGTSSTNVDFSSLAIECPAHSNKTQNIQVYSTILIVSVTMASSFISLVAIASCLYYIKKPKTKPKVANATENEDNTQSNLELYEDVEIGEHQEMIVVADAGERGSESPEPGPSSSKRSDTKETATELINDEDSSDTSNQTSISDNQEAYDDVNVDDNESHIYRRLNEEVYEEPQGYEEPLPVENRQK